MAALCRRAGCAVGKSIPNLSLKISAAVKKREHLDRDDGSLMGAADSESAGRRFESCCTIKSNTYGGSRNRPRFMSALCPKKDPKRRNRFCVTPMGDFRPDAVRHAHFALHTEEARCPITLPLSDLVSDNVLYHLWRVK